MDGSQLQQTKQSAGDAQLTLRERAERLSQLAHATPSILWTAAADGSITWVSPRWYEYTGLTPLENIKTWPQELHPDDRKRCAQAWAAALRDGSEYAIEVRHRRHDGVYRWFLTRAAPARDSAGQIVSWFGSTTEIHEFKLSEEARRESQRRLRFALESAAIGEWEVDLVTGKARTSREHDRCFGAEAPLENWSVEKFFSYVHPEERDEVRRKVRAAYEAQQDSHFECRVIWPDGSVHWLEAHSTTYLNADGKPSHVAGIVSDITARKTSEETLRQAYRHRDEFLANLSHEIRSPMAALMGYAELLSARLKDPTDRDYVKIIQNSGDHMLTLINDLLDLAKMEAGKLAIDRAPVALARLLNEVHTLLDRRAQEKGLRFTFRLDGSIPETILVDPTRLRQVLINLVGNAIKFTDRGQVEWVARFDAARARLEFEVADTGIGIPPQAQSGLFEPFEQYASAAAGRETGSGLGLAISRRLVELMGGEINCQSELGKGSTFRVILPAEVCRAESPTATAPSAPSPRLTARVLVADDREGFRYLLQHHLEAAGAEVVLVANGEEALEAFHGAEISGRPFAVVILDMRMPVLDGYETARRLRAEGFTVPIIALTAAAFEQEVQNCYGAGCDAHLLKPIEPAKLINTVARWSDARKTPSEPTATAASSGGLTRPKTLKILLIDDNHVTCKSMGMLLEMNGHEVRIAHDGQSALAIAENFSPNVVVSDIKLPDMDGFKLARALRQLNGMDKTKFIALSGYAENEFPNQEIKFHHFLHKPVKVEELEMILAS